MRPYLEVQKLIWKDKMPSLNDSDAGTLAENFDFSGGGDNKQKERVIEQRNT